MRDTGAVVVWGNCQAAPVATLLSGPLARLGYRVVPVPPVFEVDESGLAEVHDVLRDAAVLVTQPVRDEYRIPGCGADQLAALLPAGARTVRFPVTFHRGPFPFQIDGHGADGGKVDAPITDYHDLRLIAAAERGMGVDDVLGHWPGPVSESVVAELAAASVAELRRREATLDVTTSEQVSGPGAMFTMNHPANPILVSVADQVLRVLGLEGRIENPERQFLGHLRTPVEAVVAGAVGYGEASSKWRVAGRNVPWEEVVAAQLQLYRERPDVVADARSRHAERLTALAL